MTKKHFIAFALAIKTTFRLSRTWEDVPNNTKSAALDAIDIVCQVAHESNPRFDAARFRLACGVPA